MAKPVTIQDVAAAAGVSRATVSRVVNRYPTVDPELAARVRKVIDELNYNPSTLARNLSLGRTQMVAVFVPDLENPMFVSVLRGVARAAAQDGYRVLVADSEERVGEEADIIREARRRCDAVVLCAPRSDDKDLEHLLAEVAPAVVVNRSLPGLGISTVEIDTEAAAQALARHLTELGHQRIAYLAGPPSSASDKLRRAGLARADAGVEIVPIPGGSMIDDGYEAVGRVLEAGVTAVIAYNDLTAIGLLVRCRELGVAVPQTLSVVGFDDIPFARFTEPPLTTTRAPHLELGTQAWRRLLEQVEGGHALSSLRLKPELVVRGSTGRPG